MDAVDEHMLQEEAKDEDAREDLKHIEREAMAEAEASVESYDAMGDEADAVAAAETAFEFDEAQRTQ